jgi:hypothetical protein
LNVRIEGEQAMKAQWRKVEQQQEQRRNNNNYKRQTSFLNKFELEAEYKLKPAAQTMFSRAFETLKANNYWNTQVQLNNKDSERSQQQGQVKATLIIDPITQRHANVTVRTQSQAVRIESMELPGQIRPFPLIRQADKSSHSVQQLFSRWAVGMRAECSVDGRRVQTFDNTEYDAPLSRCYSVLAKDCSSEDQPRFAVMMKTLNNNDDDDDRRERRDQQQKKLKVITADQTIECQRADRYSQKLQCRVNGEIVPEHNNDAEDQTVQYNNAVMNDITIVSNNGVTVRFNGRKAWIKVSGFCLNKL